MKRRASTGESREEPAPKKRKMDDQSVVTQPTAQKPEETHLHPRVDYLHRAKIYGCMQPLLHFGKSPFLSKPTVGGAESEISTQWRLMSGSITRFASGRFPQFQSISVDGKLIFGKTLGLGNGDSEDEDDDGSTPGVNIAKLMEIMAVSAAVTNPSENTISGDRIHLKYQTRYFDKSNMFVFAYTEESEISDFCDIQKMAPVGMEFTTKFQKMLILAEGSQLDCRVDTPNAENHYATLFIALPCPKAKGGSFVLDVDGAPKKHKMAHEGWGWGGNHAFWILFLTDVPYQIEPVTEGCRCFLQFDVLIQPKVSIPPTKKTRGRKPKAAAPKKKANKKNKKTEGADDSDDETQKN